jgi:hypothetical protein
MSKINETTRNAPAIRDLTDAELDGVNGGTFRDVILDIVAGIRHTTNFDQFLRQ